jgi:hypothetical protein
MASYVPATIRANLKTLLTAVTKIAFVYDQYETNVSGYPAIIFDISKNESDMLTDAENLRKITFTLYILAEITKAGRNTAKGLLDDATQDVITALELKANQTLSGSVDWMIPTVGPRDEFATADGQVFSQRLDVVMNVASSI